MRDPKLDVLEQIIALMNDHMVEGFGPKKVEAEVSVEGDGDMEKSPAERVEGELSDEDMEGLLQMYEGDEDMKDKEEPMAE